MKLLSKSVIQIKIFLQRSYHLAIIWNFYRDLEVVLI